jgi:hypothetical protein
MEAAGLYLIGFQNGQGDVMALEGDNQPFDKYLEAKFGNEKVKNSGIKAKYIGDSWKVKVIKATLDQTLAIKSFGPGDNRITTTKEHLDRMAFVIAEAARFMPIRCAVACALHDDYRFLAVLERLSKHAQNLVKDERKAAAMEPGVTLSRRDANLRSIYPQSNIHVFEMSGNRFDGLSKTERWFRLLLASDEDLTPADRQRLRSLPPSHWYELTLGDFRSLVTNWSKLSASQDMYIHEILQEVHVRQATGSTPEDATRFMIDWY